MITAKSVIGRPTYYAPNYVNVWFARDSCSHIKFKEVKFPTVVKNDSGDKVANADMVSVAKKSSLAVDSDSNNNKTYFNDPTCPEELSENTNSVKVDLGCYLGPKCKSRKLTPKTVNHRKRSKKHEKWMLTDNFPLADNTGERFHSKTVEDALEVIKNRKKTIKAKLLVRKEHLLTQEEEQDIHTRADLYAITTIPDSKYCILTSEDYVSHSVVRYEEFQDDIYQPVRKKRRRNYGNTNCYVTHHNNDDIFDNTKMIPIGTRLLKPPTKLVELVAQAISGSPDGLLQVQQIYTFLQNKYPFFRYMDRVAINSWRSSIRHALYQKWFRKIRFDSSFISSKGCYWSINSKSNPKEWSLPDTGSDINTVEKHFSLDTLHYLDDEQETQEVAAIAKQLLSADECPCEAGLDCGQQLEPSSPDEQQHIPSPVKEPDPILSTCTPEWNNEDICISSNESGHGTMSPVNSPSFQGVLYLNQESQDCDIRTDLILGTPLNSPPNSSSDFMSLPELYLPKSHSVQPPSQKSGRTEISPLVHWTPDWEEYGSYIVSPQNLATQKYVQSLPGEKSSDSNNISVHADSAEDAKTKEMKNVCSFLQIDSAESSPVISFSCESDTESCEFEIVAEFSKPDFTSDLDVEICS